MDVLLGVRAMRGFRKTRGAFVGDSIARTIVELGWVPFFGSTHEAGRTKDRIGPVGAPAAWQSRFGV